MRYDFNFSHLPMLAIKKRDDLGMLRAIDFFCGKHITHLALKVKRLASIFLRALTSHSSLFMLNRGLTTLD